ncbi:DegT/DnrJ/EryC1/StrS family aminotransferase [Rhodococcus qingshengii]|uniref:DegT/DnrJ/EryC1/StrS family aminotransferase n=1 Tax=Rhodococcus qingshengii TaxID=334542 RepID=UPI0036DB54AF
MSISVWGYLAEYEKERDDILDAVETVFRSGQLVLGPSVAAFEQEFATLHNVRHCVGVDNGTNAVTLGLQALGVGPGDEVVTVSNTAAPTVVALDAVGATPVFVDIDPDTYLMDVEQVASAITERTRCLLPVHLYGQCVDLTLLQSISKERGIPILEDCAQAHRARHRGRIAGSGGDVASFSFYPTKVLGAYGDGGAVLTPDDDIRDRLRRLRYYGMDTTYHVEQTPGHNSRLDEVQAEILRRKLTRLDDYILRRQTIAARYAKALTAATDRAGAELVLPAVAPGNEHVYYVYVVRHPQRDRIIEEMRRADVHLNVSYPWPVHLQRGFAHLGWAEGSLPRTEAAATQIFSLPMYPSLSDTEQEHVIDALLAVLARI